MHGVCSLCVICAPASHLQRPAMLPVSHLRRRAMAPPLQGWPPVGGRSVGNNHLRPVLLLHAARRPSLCPRDPNCMHSGARKYEVKELPFGSSCWFVSAVQTHCHCEYIYGTSGSTKYTLTMKLLCPAATTTRGDHGGYALSSHLSSTNCTTIFRSSSP